MARSLRAIARGESGHGLGNKGGRVSLVGFTSLWAAEMPVSMGGSEASFGRVVLVCHRAVETPTDPRQMPDTDRL